MLPLLETTAPNFGGNDDDDDDDDAILKSRPKRILPTQIRLKGNSNERNKQQIIGA